MSDGTVTFLVPVRDPQGVSDWATVKRNMAATLRSLAQVENGRIFVAANSETDLPALPAGAIRVDVDLPYVPLPEREGRVRHEAVRADKGARVLQALKAARPGGHVMVVDYDDFVSPRLGMLVRQSPDASGWVVEEGFRWAGGRLLLRVESRFHRECGTSLCVRADLLGDPDRMSEERVRRWLGSHVFLAADLAEAGTPLAAMPFPGAVYRVGYSDSTSPTRSLRKWLSVRRMVGAPRAWLRDVLRLRLARSRRAEFSLP